MTMLSRDMTSLAHFAELKGNSLGHAVYPPSLMALNYEAGHLVLIAIITVSLSRQVQNKSTNGS